MRADRPSQTASLVAFTRALADRGLTGVPGFRDPFAQRLLPPAWAAALKVMTPWLRPLDPTKRARIAEQFDVIALRVCAIDAELERAVASGCRQVVLLGAGLDTRVYRMGVLAGAHVFEVNHPATQAFKRRRAAVLSPVVGALSYVAIDFEQDSLVASLQAAGHRAEEPTAWASEGVVMYLTEAALRTTLREVVDRSAPGSVLVAHYHEPYDDARIRFRILLLTSIWGEPQIGLRSRESMCAEIERAGLGVVRDTGTADWAAVFGAPPSTSATGRVSRVAVARRTADQSGGPARRP